MLMLLRQCSHWLLLLRHGYQVVAAAPSQPASTAAQHECHTTVGRAASRRSVRCKNIGSLTLEYIFGISFRKCFFEIESMLTSRGTISGQHLGAGIEWTWIVVMVYPCDSSKCAPLMLCLEQVLANTSLCTSHLEYICKMPSFGCPKGATLEA